jgi:hypothetical protein
VAAAAAPAPSKPAGEHYVTDAALQVAKRGLRRVGDGVSPRQMRKTPAALRQPESTMLRRLARVMHPSEDDTVVNEF